MSFSLNKILLAGNVVRNPETLHTVTGSAVTRFSVAINRTYMKGQEKVQDTLFLDCVAWGKQSEFVTKYVTKGVGVFVEGRLQTREWTDKEGNKKSKVEVVVENVQFTQAKPRQDEPSTDTMIVPDDM